MARRPLYEKDKVYKRTVQATREERDLGYGRLIDFNNRRSVQMYWNVNDAMTEDGVFILRIDGVEVYLDAEQFRKYLRWV